MGEEIDPEEIFERLIEERYEAKTSRKQMEKAAEDFVEQIRLGVQEVMLHRDFLIEKMSGWWIFRKPILVPAKIEDDDAPQFSINLGVHSWISVEIVNGIHVDICIYNEHTKDRNKCITTHKPRKVAEGIEIVLKELIKCSQI